MPAENEKIFVREVKSGYIATFNGVKGKGKTMFKAIERAQRNWLDLNLDNQEDLGFQIPIPRLEGAKDYDTATSAMRRM